MQRSFLMAVMSEEKPVVPSLSCPMRGGQREDDEREAVFGFLIWNLESCYPSSEQVWSLPLSCNSHAL